MTTFRSARAALAGMTALALAAGMCGCTASATQGNAEGRYTDGVAAADLQVEGDWPAQYGWYDATAPQDFTPDEVYGEWTSTVADPNGEHATDPRNEFANAAYKQFSITVSNTKTAEELAETAAALDGHEAGDDVQLGNYTWKVVTFQSHDLRETSDGYVQPNTAEVNERNSEPASSYFAQLDDDCTVRVDFYRMDADTTFLETFKAADGDAYENMQAWKMAVSQAKKAPTGDADRK